MNDTPSLDRASLRPAAPRVSLIDCNTCDGKGTTVLPTSMAVRCFACNGTGTQENTPRPPLRNAPQPTNGGRGTLTLQKRVTQTRLHSESVNGNCATACLASVLGGSIEEYDERVPFDDAWWQNVEGIFKEHGLLVLRLSPNDGYPSGVCFVSGQSPRGLPHLCVMQDGEIVHDPHPSRAGLVEITDYWAVIPWTFDSPTPAAP